MDEWLTSADPEPAEGTIVETEWGQRWERSPDWEGGGWLSDDASDPESWIKVAGNYGPVKVISRG